MEESIEQKQSAVSPRSVVVTYYEGDINAVVDEHFYRALSKNSTPKDLSVKHTERQTPQTSASLSPPSWATSWSRRSACPTNHTSRLLPCFPAEEATRSSSVIVSRSETPASWCLPQNCMLTPLAHQPSGAPPLQPPE